VRQRLIAEVFGTFSLVFAGTGAIVVDDTFGHVTHVGIALTFGLIVAAMIYSLGEVSGSHMNPAVSLGLCVAGRFAWRDLAPYALAQVAGAFLASGLLHLMFPEHDKLGATLPSGPDLQSWAMEFVLTLILMVVVMGVVSGSSATGAFAGVAIGSAIALEALFAGPVSGASMNPVRSLAPAVVSGHIERLWIYLSAPVAGAVAGVGVWRLMEGPE